MTAQLELEQRLVEQLERAAARRVVEAREEYYLAAKAYGLNLTETQALAYAPFALRVDAWLERTRRLLPGHTGSRDPGPPARCGSSRRDRRGGVWTAYRCLLADQHKGPHQWIATP